MYIKDDFCGASHSVEVEEDKDVNGIKELKNECYKPSYDDLKIENERFCNLYRKSQELVSALESSLRVQNHAIIELEQNLDFYKEQYYKANQRADNLYEKLAKLEAKKNNE